MTQYVVWRTPWHYGGLSFEHVECISKMKVEDAIKYQRGVCSMQYGHEYDSDEDALYDFISIHYAVVREEE